MNKLVKKILSGAVAGAMVLSFAACSGSSSMTATEGKLVMATNAAFPPYEYVEGGEVVGIDAEIAQAIADKLGLELEIQDVDFDSIIAGVASGKYDMGMAGMTVTEERKQSVNFTTSYATGVQSVIIPDGSEITDIDTLLSGDYQIGVQKATTADIYLSDTPENGGVGTDRVTEYNNGADAVQALVTGKVDAVVIDNNPAEAFVAANPGLVILPTAYAEEEYAICVNLENQELLDAVNGALEELIADGTVDSIIAEYIHD